MSDYLEDLISNFKNNFNSLDEQSALKMLHEIVFFDSKTYMHVVPKDQFYKFDVVAVRYLDLPMAVREYQTPLMFCRARKVSDFLENPTYDDFWEPPASFVKKGRVNGDNEQLLYVASHPSTAASEARVENGDLYLLMFYQATEIISLVEIGFDHMIVPNKNNSVTQDFLHGVFKEPNDYVYMVSNFIAKQYFGVSDGWAYPSVAANGRGTNFCLKLSVKDKLKLLAAFTFKDGEPVSAFNLSNIDSINITSQEDALLQWQKICETSNVNAKENVGLPIQGEDLPPKLIFLPKAE
jgi:hypothetical protein